jgi:hypothetical protein
MEDALALRGEEGRGKLRKAAGRSTHSVIRRCPNGATLGVEDTKFRIAGGEPGELKHLSTRRRRKQK